MPRENINCTTDAGLRAQVSWSRDAEYVQLATIRARKPVVTTANVPGVVATSVLAVPVQSDGWFVDLNREQINRLIRVLRRARDSAFGSDA